MRESSRRTIAVAALLLLWIVPGFYIVSVSIGRKMGAYRAAQEKTITSGLGLPCRIGVVDHPRPGVVRLRELEFLWQSGSPICHINQAETSGKGQSLSVRIDEVRTSPCGLVVLWGVAKQRLNRPVGVTSQLHVSIDRVILCEPFLTDESPQIGGSGILGTDFRLEMTETGEVRRLKISWLPPSAHPSAENPDQGQFVSMADGKQMSPVTFEMELASQAGQRRVTTVLAAGDHAIPLALLRILLGKNTMPISSGAFAGTIRVLADLDSPAEWHGTVDGELSFIGSTLDEHVSQAQCRVRAGAGGNAGGQTDRPTKNGVDAAVAVEIQNLRFSRGKLANGRLIVRESAPRDWKTYLNSLVTRCTADRLDATASAALNRDVIDLGMIDADGMGEISSRPLAFGARESLSGGSSALTNWALATVAGSEPGEPREYVLDFNTEGVRITRGDPTSPAWRLVVSRWTRSSDEESQASSVTLNWQTFLSALVQFAEHAAEDESTRQFVSVLIGVLPSELLFSERPQEASCFVK